MILSRKRNEVVVEVSDGCEDTEVRDYRSVVFFFIVDGRVIVESTFNVEQSIL